MKTAECEGKIGFETPALARKVNTRRSNQQGKYGIVYKCENCKLWHIGRKNQIKEKIKY
jgi:hypothetical protein